MSYSKPVNKFVKRDTAIGFEIMDLKKEIAELCEEVKKKRERLKKLESR